MKNPNWTKDELILALDLYFRLNLNTARQQHPEIVALSSLLNKLPIHKDRHTEETFRNPNGVYMKLCNFMRLDPEVKGSGLKAGSKYEQKLWDTFADNKKLLSEIATAIKNKYQSLSPDDVITHEDEEFFEGKILTSLHKRRERNSRLTDKKKQTVLKQTGSLACEICSFDFHQAYGPLGYGFAECHHNKPLATLNSEQKTKLSDLTIVCANCHRMLHRAKPWISVQDLKHNFTSQQS